MLSTVAREIKKRNKNAYIHVITGLPKIFERNPDINKVSPEPQGPDKEIGNHLIRYENKFPWKRHILYDCAECVDIKDEIELRTYIFPDENDFLWAKSMINNINKKIILINRKAGPRTDKKNWPDQYWNTLVPRLTENFFVIELGTNKSDGPQESITNYLNLNGKTTIHQTAALMSMAHLLICPVTGLLHLASAYNLKTLCILGGSEPEAGTKYANTHYLTNRPSCADCYEKGPCGFDFVCLKEISPEMVLQSAKNLL
jgi:ADP-heptose:LPS heptosyltransferase